MIVDAKTLKKWKIRVRYGEKSLIASKMGLRKSTVSNAFNGHAAIETIDKINNYFKTNK
jgi:hypothetical protein